MDPGRAQSLLELSQTNDVYVDELHNFITLCGAAGLVAHNLLHDPGERQSWIKLNWTESILEYTEGGSDSLLKLGERRWDADVVSEQVQGGDEVTPLNQLPQRTPAERVLRYFKTRLLRQETQVHQDLKKKKIYYLSDINWV